MEKDKNKIEKDGWGSLTPEDVKLPLDWKKLDNLPF